MKLRKAVLEDAGIIADFNLKLARETEGLTLDLGTVSAGVTALLRDPAKGIYYVAEEDSRVVGQLCLTYEWSDWRNGNFWWIQSVYVRAEFRGRGIFPALFGHIERLAGAREDVCGLRLYMERDNERARRVYRKIGLEETHYQVFEKISRPPAA
jgi:GNAT superfamily N-acetyltransferase